MIFGRSKFVPKKPSPLIVLITGLLVLLAVLATLQYRWLGRVGSQEREVLRTDLQAKTRGFCDEFDQEITRAFATFKIDSDTFQSENRNRYAERFDKWAKTSTYPKIVKNVFLIETKTGGNPRLLVFNQSTKMFETSEWKAAGLENLQRRFEQQPNSDSTEKNILKGQIASIVEEVPALVSVIAAVEKDLKNDYRKYDWQHPLGYVVTLLDLDYIKNQLFPQLADKYFGSAAEGNAPENYDITISTRNEPKEIIYQSNPEAAENSAADVSGKLFNISFDKVQSYSNAQVYDAPNAQTKENSQLTLVIPATNNGTDDTAAKVLLTNDGARWQLKVNHYLGSLDAVVARSRWWNLSLSFGILLLLGISIVIIAVLSRRSQKLAQRQMEFVAGVSHEFRTPLAVIHSLSENLAAGRIKDAEKVKNYGATIHKDVRRLTEMVEQILQFAGAESAGGKYFYNKNPVDVEKLIKKVFADNFSQINEEGWSVEMEIQPNLPFVLADETALERALQNLIGNAMKFSNGNRWLKITADCSADKRQVNISVADRGIGIPESERQSIFEPFYRGREAVEAQIHGNGIGLSLVKQIIEAHNCKISVESNSGKDKGSIFTLHLPVSDQ